MVTEAATGAELEAQITELGDAIGTSLKRLRTRRGLSLEALARQAGVSRAMIGQIEGGRSMPTIGLLWKIARALDVPFAALMGGSSASGVAILRADQAKLLTSKDGSFTSRALFPFDAERRVEFYELTMGPHALEEAGAHAPGTTENLTVVKGEVEIAIGQDLAVLKPGDAIFFIADQPHHYRNLSGQPAQMFLVMTYANPVG